MRSNQQFTLTLLQGVDNAPNVEFLNVLIYILRDKLYDAIGAERGESARFLQSDCAR